MATLILLAALAADGGEAPTLKTRLRSVALFKNGYAFHVREALCPAVASADLAPIPVPVHGTFWIASDPSRLRIVEAVGSREAWKETVQAVDIDGILRANVGKEIIVHLGDQPLRTKVLRVTEPPPPEPGARPEDPYRREGLVILATPTGEMAVPRHFLGRVESVQGPLADRVERTRESLRLRVKLDPRSGTSAPLVVSYLARGATWAPSYAVDIGEAARARITAKAEVFCEEEDLEDAALWFVTGFPNLGLRAVTSPIAMRGDLSEFLNSLYRAGARPEEGAMLMQQTVYAASQVAAFPVVDRPAAGEGEEDLFFYERKGVTLRRGERGYYPLFTASVPYEHLYEWLVPDTLSQDPAYPRREERKPEVVWHSLRLTNETRTPWTTAPAMAMKDDRLLGQDVLHYTAPGARTVLRITQAVDLGGQAEEVETQRQRKAAEIHGSSYDLVNVQGELRIANHKAESVVVEVTKVLSGEMVEPPPGAEVTSLAKGLKAVNPTLRLFAKLPVKAGETATARYVYRLYVRG